MNTVARLALLSMLANTCAAQQHHPRMETFKSPDGRLIAIVTSTNQPEATPESRVEIRTAEGKVLAHDTHLSDDGEHGYGVTKASWTPDSQYFVYSLESSGGHQAWHSPVQYFSRNRSKILSLDDALNDSVMDPQFTVAAPDKITVALWFRKQTLTISLSDVHPVR